MASRSDAVLFDLDGVVTDTARVHAAVWTQMFDAFLKRWSQEHNIPFEPFTPHDYLSYVDGRPRTEAIRTFTACRGVSLPEGDRSDGLKL
jgi:beta-phosphoglucomutase-like phosphatase (HAD superfamily)